MKTMALLHCAALELEPESYRLDSSKLIAANPEQQVWNYYTDPTGRFCAGIRQREVGNWAINCTEEEFCQLLESVGMVTDIDGVATTLAAADDLVIPRGFQGTREVVEATRKLSAIYQEPTT